VQSSRPPGAGMSAIDHPDLEIIYQYWLSKKCGRAMPSRADIDPVELPGRLWPNLMLIDVVRDQAKPRFRYRHVGTAFSDAVGRELTGQFLNEVMPSRGGYRDYILGIYEELIRRRQAMYTENVFLFQQRAAPLLMRRLSMPLSTDGVTVDIAFVGHSFDYDRSYFDNGYVSQVTGVEQLTRIILSD
jgi:hypothetical protein